MEPAGTSSPVLAAGTHAMMLHHGGRERPYVLHAPATIGGGAVPLVIELHGRGIDPISFDGWTGFRSLADEAGFVVALPAAEREIWNDGRGVGPPGAEPDDVAYLLALMDDVATRFPVDRRRVYVVGMSNGATMAGRLACEHPERLAGMAQVAGTAAVSVAATCRPSVPVPVVQIHGTGDMMAPYEGGRRRGLQARILFPGRGAAGPSVGVDEWARHWVEANGAGEGPHVETLPPDTTIRRWRGSSPMADVVFYRVEGGGHTWPGNRLALPGFLFGRTSRTFDATRVAWVFLAAHARDA
jgi:polyhydroxybutyrate depolymerase